MTVYHRFSVITSDTSQRYAEGIRVIPQVNKWGTHWNQLEIYNPDLFDEGSNCLYLDQDCIIIGNIDFFTKPYRGALAGLIDCDWIFHPQYNGQIMYNSGITRWYPNHATAWLYNFYNTDNGKRRGQPLVYRDQQFTQFEFKQHEWKLDYLQDIHPGKIMGYRNEWLKQPENRQDCAIITFAGHPKPHEITDTKLLEYWKL